MLYWSNDRDLEFESSATSIILNDIKNENENEMNIY